jgi:hypothetical protein
MTLRFGKPLYVYFCAAMLTIFTVMSVGVYMYWEKGPANMDRVAQIFESTVQLDSLNKEKGFKKVKNLVQRDRVREAISYYENLQTKVSSLNNLESIESYDSFEKDMQQLKTSLNNMLSFSSKSTLISVLRTKVTNFKSFVVHNQWRTLTRVSSKIQAKISTGASKSPSFYTYRKMNALHKSITKDIKYMEAVTQSSVLSREDKNLIMIKLGTLKTELNLLAKSLNSLRDFYKSYAVAEKSYAAWKSNIEPALALKKINIVKSSEKTLYAMGGMVALVLLFFIIGHFVYARGGRSQKVQVEQELLGVIKEGLIPVKASINDSWSQQFKEEIDRYREYVHKRMSFGSIFQDAMPFSSILMDSNLNLVWANTLFYEHWNLDEKVKQDSNVTWDFLQRFTNLGENDPVVSAIKENIAGIYQIQVKTENSEEAAPFEMYVSPVEYAGQKRIMVIFYPLRSLEETLGNQMKSLVSPVSKTLDALIDNKFQGEFIDRVRDDFEAAGIEHIFKKFTRMNDFYLSQRNGLMNEIETIENTLFEQYKIMDDVKIVFDGQKDLQHDAIAKFSSAKEHIVSVVDMRSQFEFMMNQMTELGSELFEEELTLITKATDISEVMEENTRAMESLVRSRDDFKKLKSQVEMFRSRVGQILEHSRNSDWSSAKNVQGLQRLKSELMDFENVLTSFSRVATSLDVGLSKVQIIMQSKEMPEMTQTKQTFETLRAQMEELSSEASKLGRVGQAKDEELIKSLKGLFLSFQNLRTKSKELDDMIMEPYQNEPHNEVELTDHNA